jgi:hypothetical protein
MTADLGRRDVLGIFGAAGAALAASPAIAKRPTSFTSEVGRKFYPDGRVHPFRGNTIVCHVDQQGPNSALFEVLLDIYRQLPALGFANKISALPPSSYHMTIFGGANHPERKPGLWPASIPLDTPIEECTRILGERIEKAKLGPIAPIKMRVDLSEPVERETPFTIRLLPLDEAENRRLRALRDKLSEILEIRSPSHDSYRFHVTLAYLIRTLDPAEHREFRAAYRAQHAEVAKRCPVIEFGQPEYCSLEDMFHFKRLFYI